MAATARIGFRVTPEHEVLFRRAAELTGRSLTAFAMEALVDRATAIVEGPTARRRRALRDAAE